MLLSPPAIVLVALEILLDDNVDDVIRRTLDESRRVFEQLLHRLLDLYCE